MQMIVSENVTLFNPLGDGRDLSAGAEIDLPLEVAMDWECRGWVRQKNLSPLPPLESLSVITEEGDNHAPTTSKPAPQRRRRDADTIDRTDAP